MLFVLAVLIAFLASFVGSISGIGGGIIIKPVLDLTGQIPIETVNFLSGVTVLTMTTSTLIQNFFKNKHQAVTNNKTKSERIIVLCIGSVLGGFLGSYLFNIFMDGIGSQSMAVLVQAILIFFMTLIVMFYQWNKTRIKTLNLQGIVSAFLVGFVLGTISAFLGIGGGTLNIAILAFSSQ